MPGHRTSIVAELGACCGRIVVPRDVNVVAAPGGSMTTATLVLTAYLEPEGDG